MNEQGNKPHGQAKEPGQTGRQGNGKPPQTHSIGKVPARQGKAADSRHGHSNESRRRNELGLYRRCTHHQATDDGDRLANGLGQVYARFLQQFKGHQQPQHLHHRRKWHRLLALNHGL